MVPWGWQHRPHVIDKETEWWCAGNVLTTSFSGKEIPSFMTFSNFHDVNAPTALISSTELGRDVHCEISWAGMTWLQDPTKIEAQRHAHLQTVIKRQNH